MAFKLPELDYGYDALEPYIDARTMEIHHSKHHQGYVDKANNALQGTDFENMDVEEVLKNLDNIPEEKRVAVLNNAGGHYNHSLFWKIMSPNGGGKPEGKLAEKIDQDLGGFDKFKEDFTEAAKGRFGSGWAWLIVNAQGRLEITSTPNQNNPITEEKGIKPILGIDVWEHAYYLKYQNKRPEYIEQWFNVVDWKKVEEKL